MKMWSWADSSVCCIDMRVKQLSILWQLIIKQGIHLKHLLQVTWSHQPGPVSYRGKPLRSSLSDGDWAWQIMSLQEIFQIWLAVTISTGRVVSTGPSKHFCQVKCTTMTSLCLDFTKATAHSLCSFLEELAAPHPLSAVSFPWAGQTLPDLLRPSHLPGLKPDLWWPHFQRWRTDAFSAPMKKM